MHFTPLLSLALLYKVRILMIYEIIMLVFFFFHPLQHSFTTIITVKFISYCLYFIVNWPTSLFLITQLIWGYMKHFQVLRVRAIHTVYTQQSSAPSTVLFPIFIQYLQISNFICFDLSFAFLWLKWYMFIVLYMYIFTKTHSLILHFYHLQYNLEITPCQILA